MPRRSRPACPAATVQLIYRTSHAGRRAARFRPAHRRDRLHGQPSAGLKLKAAADAAGKPIYLELSAVNPVVVLPGALAERGRRARRRVRRQQLDRHRPVLHQPESRSAVGSGKRRERFVAGVRAKFRRGSPDAAALGRRRCARWARVSPRCRRPAASLVTGGAPAPRRATVTATRCCVFRADAFLAAPLTLQTEAFGNAALFVVARDAAQLETVVRCLEGSLTGGFYTDTRGSDDALYDRARAAAAHARGTPAQRQDADRRRRQPGDEPRRPVSRRPAIPASPRSASRRRCGASRCCSATTTCARPPARRPARPAAPRSRLPPGRRGVAPRPAPRGPGPPVNAGRTTSSPRLSTSPRPAGSR